MSNPAFGAQLLTLPAIFKNKYFIIPDYQRGYAWDEKQVQDLLQDINHLLDDGISQKHYTGTLVLSRIDNNSDFHVVDGQQRLTTLTIVIRGISEHLTGEKKSEIEELYLRRGVSGSERGVLRLNSDTRRFYENVIINGNSKSSEPARLEAHDRLLKAQKVIKKWINKRTAEKTKILDILKTVETELGFIVFAPEEDSETGVMFEVINNRGKDLSELEKIKNYLIYCSVKLNAETLRDDIDAEWSVILRNLHSAKKTTDADENAFLRYCMAVHFKLNKTDSQHGYIQLKKTLKLDKAIKTKKFRNFTIEKISAFIYFLKNASHWYARLYGQQHEGLSRELARILDQIRGQDRQASIMPLFLALVVKNQVQSDYLTRLLQLLEILNFRVYIARKMTNRNDSGQGYLYDYAAAYYHDELTENLDTSAEVEGIDTEDKALEFQLVDFIFWLAPESKFLESFKLAEGDADDFYHWNGLRYFLMNYEQDLQPNKTIMIDRIVRSRQEGKSNDYLSVEHLWAIQNRAEEGENNRPVDKFEKRRLGNFVLLELRLNIQGNCDDLELKINRYADGESDEAGTDLQHVREAVKSAKKGMKKYKDKKRSKNYYLDLYRGINDANEDRYIEFAASRWSISCYSGYDETKIVYEEAGE